MIRTTIFISLALNFSAQAVPIFIGTSTGKNTSSKGIYVADFNSDTGQLSEPTLAVEYGDPNFLALHPNLPILYACGSPTTPYADGSGSIAAFKIENNTKLTFTKEVSSAGQGVCHISVDASGRTLAAANYNDGGIATIRLRDDGGLGELVSKISNTGNGPNKSRQEGPHAHGVHFDNTNSHLLVPDLGLDQVLVYPFDEATSKLGAPLPSLVTAPGAGPRHLTFSGDGKNGYVINELDNTVLAASYDAGKFTSLGTLPTLPQSYSGTNTTAEIEVHANGKYVYASNRTHDSIVVFSRDEKSGKLELIHHAPCGGKIPRHFKIDPTGRWLLCAHMESHTISVLPLDLATGKLGAPIQTVNSPSPICLVFGRDTQ